MAAATLINKLLLQKERLDLKVTHVQTAVELEELCVKGLVDLYRQVFSGPPYFEEFTPEEVYEGFANTLQAGGILFVAHPSSGQAKPIAFVSSHDIHSENGLAEIVKEHVDVEAMAYFAEDGVAPEFRRQGVSAYMKGLLLEANWLMGNENVLLRTSARNYPQISATTKAGARVVYGLQQSVSSKRQDGTTKEDRRSFYLFSKNSLSCATSVKGVSIFELADSDVAVVGQEVPKESQQIIAQLIRQVYTEVANIHFSDNVAPSPAKIFSGSLYLPDRTILSKSLIIHAAINSTQGLVNG